MIVPAVVITLSTGKFLAIVLTAALCGTLAALASARGIVLRSWSSS